jgi:signal transduction histidine kinase
MRKSLPRRLDVIDRSANRMETLIRDLVDATRMEHAGVELAIRDERVESIIRDAVELFSPLVREKALEMTAGLDVEGVNQVAIAIALLQVLGKPDRQRREVHAGGGTHQPARHSAGREVRFEVEDTGPGIRPDHLPHIFERYWTSTRKEAGSACSSPRASSALTAVAWASTPPRAPAHASSSRCPEPLRPRRRRRPASRQRRTPGERRARLELGATAR